uniref:Transposon Ty3-I Gag-Pol polyprotein n=1 Tax=Cajanus cajan TaxID=3821 RepID=A0A151REE7_CAJCA|nr:Transposon Ty3-I Gag-Pol polyprotein [Cajanus cajan]
MVVRKTTRWKMCIDFIKLNEATWKDHFPLPFVNQMLEELVRQSFFYYFDGYSGYLQIPLALQDQAKSTFTCPYGTFAYKWMLFGLCIARTIFQRCMMTIFSNFIKDYIEIFMDVFSILGPNFDKCLSNLDLVLKICKCTNLV